MRFLRSLIFALSLLGLPVAASAQVQFQESPTHIDSAIAVCTLSAAVAVNQQETVTCTPPAGQYVYVVGISFDACTDGTGSAVNQVTWTTTNITGSPTYSLSLAATASICQHWQEPLTQPLKSTAAGTAVTFVSPAAATHNSYHARVYVYYAP